MPMQGFRKKTSPKTTEPTEYKEQLRQALLSYQKDLPDEEDVIIASFDAATTGRLAITYYNELRASDFLKRMQKWDERCCWNSRFYGISAPSLPSIVTCAFGIEREGNGKATIETDDKIMRQQLQVLLNCRLGETSMPFSIMHALTERASNPLAYKKEDNRETVLFTACAVIRKYLYDTKKEEWFMAFDYTKADRSYQFGGLLALLEKAERDTYGEDESREPNAIRMQSVFSKRPMYAAKVVWEQVKKSYLPRLKVGLRFYYEQRIGAIWERLDSLGEEHLNEPLTETYLLGYYLMRNELYTKQNKNEKMEEN